MIRGRKKNEAVPPNDDPDRRTPAEILKKIRALEIKTRGLVQSAFAGDYHSVFK